MTEEKKSKTAKTSTRNGHTMADVALTIYDDVKSAAGVQALSEAGNAVLVSAGGTLLLIHRKVANFVNEQLAKKAESIPSENRQSPDPTTMAKVVPALNTVFGEENLREMFLNLLAASMDKTKAGNVLPAFVEVIKQLSPDEALILQFIVSMGGKYSSMFPLVDVYGKKNDGHTVFLSNYSCLTAIAKCSHQDPESDAIYISNMRRLGLFDTNSEVMYGAEDLYQTLAGQNDLIPIKRKIIELGLNVECIRKSGVFTPFGKKFCKYAIQK